MPKPPTSRPSGTKPGTKAGQLVSGKNFSKVDVKVITKHEGGSLTKGYVPSQKSGVTIAAGYDLGQQTGAGLKSLGLSKDLTDKMSKYLGLKGQAAKDALAKNPLRVTAEQAAQIDKAVFRAYFNATGQAFDSKSKTKFSGLPWQGQTVIADLWYNMGDLRKAAPTLWKQLTSNDWASAYKNLSDFSHKDKVLARRAKDDARLLKEAIDNGSLPK